MTLKASFFALAAALAILHPVSAKADSLNYVSHGSTNAGDAYVYPYNFSVNGSSTLTSLMCLDCNRDVNPGQTWAANKLTVPLDNSITSTDYHADAWLFGQLNTHSVVDVQFAVWSLFDPTDTGANSAFSANASQLAEKAVQMAQNATLLHTGYFSNYVLYTPDAANQSGWTYGIPQRFIGAASPTPELSTLALLGTGLVALTGIARIKFNDNETA